MCSRESRVSSIRDRMKAVMVGSSPAAACVVVRTPTDEHSVPQRPLTAKYYVVVNDSESGAALFCVFYQP